MKDILICDTECYPNFWSIGFRRHRDGKTRVFEHSERKKLTDAERENIRAIMEESTLVGYNFLNYDAPMIALVLARKTNARLKQANDRIIVDKMKPWHADREWEEGGLGVRVPRWDIIDLIETQPNARASLKTLMGRMHAPKLQDLPYEPDHVLTESEMDDVLAYMGNDLHGTGMLFDALEEPLNLRRAIGEKHGINLLSKSDSQCGEQILKVCVEREIGERVYKAEVLSGTMFKYKPPEFIAFESTLLADVFERIKETDFVVRRDAKGKLKVELPAFLADNLIRIGDSAYQMGIGGLHSTEKNRSLVSDDQYQYVDADVASYYPRTTINSGLYPKALGPAFLPVYKGLTDGRVVAKNLAKQLGKLEKERSLDPDEQYQLGMAKAEAEGVKIFVNGGGFGKLGSEYSILFAPQLMIYVTLTGQLAIFMLIERMEAAGIPVVSANTDGIVLKIHRDLYGEVKDDRILSGVASEVIAKWESDTGFTLEAVPYRGIYNRSVNDYIAIKEDGSVKWKGVVANPWRATPGFKPDIRAQLMKNPQMPIVANAVVDLILHGTPIEETIRASRDVRDFVTVVKVDGGAFWQDRYLGKVVRYIWAQDGEEIFRKKPHPTTGNHGRVPKTEGCRPLMDLPKEFPDDLNYERYFEEAREALMNIGYNERPDPIRPLRLYKWSAWAWFAVAV